MSYSYPLAKHFTQRLPSDRQLHESDLQPCQPRRAPHVWRLVLSRGAASEHDGYVGRNKSFWLFSPGRLR